MNEFLDYYDEEGNLLGTTTYDEVHEKGYWHNTVHCWLYTIDGKLMFQVRANRGTFYTTASGHVKAGETIPQAFHREIKEEIGLNLDTQGATFVDIVPWQMDKIKDGKEWHDRAKANVYINLYEGDYSAFNMDPEEVSGIGVVSAEETLDLFNDKVESIEATIIEND
jgi:isopentenyldiphosphate isomerase